MIFVLKISGSNVIYAMTQRFISNQQILHLFGMEIYRRSILAPVIVIIIPFFLLKY